MSTETERRLLLLEIEAMPDPEDLLTWTIDGRSLTTDEIRLLHGITVEDAIALTELLRVQLELEQAINSPEWGGVE